MPSLCVNFVLRQNIVKFKCQKELKFLQGIIHPVTKKLHLFLARKCNWQFKGIISSITLNKKINRVCKHYSVIPIDLTLEQTVNADAASSSKGRPICSTDIFIEQINLWLNRWFYARCYSFYGLHFSKKDLGNESLHSHSISFACIWRIRLKKKRRHFKGS